jgi:hypothetical protein
MQNSLTRLGGPSTHSQQQLGSSNIGTASGKDINRKQTNVAHEFTPVVTTGSKARSQSGTKARAPTLH